MIIKNIYGVFIYFIIVLLFFIFSIFININMVTAKNIKFFKVINNWEPSTLDPHLEQGDWETNITRNMFWGLYVYDGKNKLVPGLAKNYFVSNDGKKYTFNLKHLKWSNGREITAYDVVFSIRRSLSPELASKHASMLFSIKNAKEYNQGKVSKEKLGVKAINDHTVQFVLESATPYFLSLTATYPAKTLPQYAIEKYGKRWTKPKNIVVSGPYILKYWKPNDKVIIVKRNDFYNAKNVKIDKIEFHSATDALTAEKQYLTGEYDWSLLVDESNVRLLKKSLGRQVKTSPILATYYYVFNNDNTKLKNIKVKQALAMAIDRNLIAHKIMKDSFIPAKSWVPNGISNYLSNKEQPVMAWSGFSFKKRLKIAKRYLTEAGYNKSNPLEITISYNRYTDGSNRKIAVAVASEWKKIGVKVKLYNTDAHTHYTNMANGNYIIGRGSWNATYNDPMAMLFLFSSDIHQNYGNYKNANVDRWLIKASKEINIKKRSRLFAKVEKQILNDVPYIPLFYHVKSELVSDKVSGWHYNILDIHPIWLMDINK